MTSLRRQKWMFALLALVLLFAAGCKSESPTSPGTTGGNPPPTGGTPPPTGASVVVTTSSSNVQVGSQVTVTATVTENNAPVPNGTAVQFTITPQGAASFIDTNSNTTIRTTTGGVATAVLTSATAGTATITVAVNNVVKQTSVKFNVAPSPTPQPNTLPTITSVTCSTCSATLTGKPQGGDTIIINGTNFRSPVRVTFDDGAGHIKDAFVSSVTATQIVATTPPFSITTGQQLKATIKVFVSAGNPDEASVAATSQFTFQTEVLTPTVITVAPTSGPATGGTRVTIIGDGFQAPMQVFFGAAEAQVVSITFNQVVVLSPPARDTSDNGSGVVTGPVDLRVLNINSNKSNTLAAAFRYTPKAVITAVGPTEGPIVGGTRVQIDGTGFEDPVAVVIGGIAAQPIKVSGTQIIAITGTPVIAGCSDVSGPTSVTNISTGDSAIGVNFTFRVPKPVVLGVTSGGAIVPGASFNVLALNVSSFPILKIGTTAVPITTVSQNPNGTFNVVATVPNNVVLNTQSCGSGGGTAPLATSFDVVLTNADTSCTSTLTNGITVNPAPFGKLFLTPNPLNLTATAATVAPPPGTPAVNGSGFFTIVNTGGAPLTITGIVTQPTPPFTNGPPSQTNLAVCESALVQVSYQAGSAGQQDVGTSTVSATTNATNISAVETLVGSTK